MVRESSENEIIELNHSIDLLPAALLEAGDCAADLPLAGREVVVSSFGHFC